jgi:hypothetical protein
VAEEGTSRYQEIADRLSLDRAEVGQGRMMSSPGLSYRGKYFAFVQGGAMVFRLGKEITPEELGLASVRPLNPYKTKPPVAGWFVVDESEQDRWEDLARRALARMEADLTGKRGKGSR